MAVSLATDIRTFEDGDIDIVNNLIGSGGMGIVSLAQWRVKDQEQGIYMGDYVAVKRLEITGNLDTIKREAKMLWRLHENCDNILRLYGLLKSDTGICLVLDYMKHGNVLDFFSEIHSDSQEELWPLKLQICEQICHGMKFLHSKNIIHCDLKAANVLLDDNLNAKICDFGLAKIKLMTTKPSSNPERSEANKLKHNPAGTITHIAPELLNVHNRPSKSSDMYSFGILLWELLSDTSPYQEANSVIIAMNVENGTRPDLKLIPSGCPAILKKIMEDAWQHEAKNRPKFIDILQQLDRENQVEKSVAFALQAWNKKKFPSCAEETVPKNVATRPADFKNYRPPNSAPYSFPTATDRLIDPNIHVAPAVQPVANISRLRTDDLCISEDEISITYSTASSKPLVREEHTAGNVKDFASPSSVSMRSQNHRPRSNKILKIFTHFIVGAVFAAATFTVLHFVQSWSITKGCCLNCFNPYDPNLKSSCLPTISSEGDLAPVDTVCNFNCSSGFVLNGSMAELTCNKDGIWSGPLPYCRKIRQCSALNAPANGGSLQCTNQNYENSKCTFICPEGSKMKFSGSSQSATVTCQADDVFNYHWTGQEPYCEKVVQCKTPTSDSNVKVECSKPTIHASTILDNTYVNGTTCQFVCITPMSLDAADTYGLCQDDGTWNVTSGIKCIKGCSDFPAPPKSNYTCTKGRLENSRCTFTCHDNFVMVGSNNMVCHYGKWLNPPPRCECPSCRSGSDCNNTVNFTESWEAMNTTKNVIYDGYLFICTDVERVYSKKSQNTPLFGCQCRDRKLNHNKQCNDDTSQTLACKKAFASLILIMSYNRTLTLPCDAENMPTECLKH